jgi:hypothetical protein
MVKDSAKISVEAEFSDDRQLRFSLSKLWNSDKPNALFILLNPSKADVLRVDNTFCNIINQCIDLDYGSVTLVNLFPLMATEQKELRGKLELGKSENLDVIERELSSTNDVFIAWGSEHYKYKERKLEFEALFKKHEPEINLRCWYNKDDSYPKHLRIVGK